MKITRVIFFTLSLVSVSKINAQSQVSPRSQASCGFLMNSIYCFGGIVDGSSNADNSVNKLNLDVLRGTSTSDLQNKWTTIAPNTNGIDLESRSSPQSMPLPDGKTMVFNGGYKYASPIKGQTIAFDVSTNLWSNYPNYSEDPYGSRQIYEGTSVYVPGLGVGFYGGLEQNINPNWTIPTGQNFSKATFGNGQFRVVGFTQMTFLNVENGKTSQPWYVPPSQINVPRTYSVDMTSVYDPVSQNVYFFGGDYHDLDSTTFTTESSPNRLFSSSLYYNIPTNTWGTQSWGGVAIPSARKFHTTTLLSSTNRDILLYGGEQVNLNIVASDYCYVLNLDSKKWTQVVINNAPPDAILPRTKHSAVMVGNETLFIVFGKDTASVGTSSMVLLNVADPNNITYSDKYPATGSLSADLSAGLSTGAIAGIAVGSVIAGLLILGVCIFFILKKRIKQKEIEDHVAIKQIQDQDQEHGAELIEVDWDAIENKYNELPPANFADKAQFSMMNTDGSTTFRDSEDLSLSPIKKVAPNVLANVPDVAEYHKPNVYRPQLVVKPDGADF